MVIWIVSLILVVLILILLLYFMRVYVLLDWKIDSDNSDIIISLSVFRIPIMKKKIELFNISTLQDNKSSSLKSYWTSFQYLLSKMRFEGITFDLAVGTGNPAYTAFLYPFLQIMQTINDQEYRVAVNFERKFFESAGQCMISVRLCHTRKVIGILKQLQGKGDT